VAIESCPCLICKADPAGRHDDLVETVRKHGWSPLWIAGEIGFAYTVGVWHTFGQPEIVMFGLEGPGMQLWLNTCVEVGRDQGWPPDDTPFEGVLENFPTQLRPVHPSWHEALFGAAHRFYQGTRVPVRQLVWPDRNGRWPWDEQATLSSRTRQALSWLPVDQHPMGGWRLVGELAPTFAFPFGPDSWVLTTMGILDGHATVEKVVRDQAGYDVLDGHGYGADDLCLAFLGDVVRSQPHLNDCADLVDGQTATRSADGGWERSYIAKDERRASKRCWTLAEPAPRYHPAAA
jgi:Domain of unknown function (DUF4262)